MGAAFEYLQHETYPGPHAASEAEERMAQVSKQHKGWDHFMDPVLDCDGVALSFEALEGRLVARRPEVYLVDPNSFRALGNQAVKVVEVLASYVMENRDSS
ncbi:hypothetical protein BGZ65_012166 [Modicella reniformis]|uniref:Uncharacterized protein n=1 Tax=Modicella reniformis TaxID=1440133 RepID=A0A9P6SQ36_9FUNG|nr:hypothetical protein BGZ65_012166 [Modicella reniformis]